MGRSIQQQVEACIEAFRQGSLTEASLLRIVELAGGPSKQQDGSSKRQSLLYLQSKRTSITSAVIGMSLFKDGQFHDPPGTEDWPYGSVAEAMAEGWRIVKFPEMALLVDETRTYGFGCEFILEKWE